MESALAVHEERELPLGDPVRPAPLGIDVRQLAIDGGHPVVGGRTVSTSRCPAESSSSSPSARSPSGPGLSALMNMLVIEQGPGISMPGFRRSAGTGGTRHSPVLMALSGGGVGGRASRSARARTSARVARRAWTRGAKVSWSRTRYPAKAGVNSSAAPSTGGWRRRVAADMRAVSFPVSNRHLFAWPRRGRQWQNVPALAATPPRRFRGLAHGRKTRRTLARGGVGHAQRLNQALGGWAGVRITPMFGRWGYFVGERLFACFPLREQDRDLWVRLTPVDQVRALADPRVRPHRRFARRGWVELDVGTGDDLTRALPWLRRAWRAASAASADEEDPPG